MPEPIDAISVPWPARETGMANTIVLRRGGRVVLQHIVHRTWLIEATITNVTTPGRSVEVLPDEPITSPANWEIVA